MSSLRKGPCDLRFTCNGHANLLCIKRQRGVSTSNSINIKKYGKKKKDQKCEDSFTFTISFFSKEPAEIIDLTSQELTMIKVIRDSAEERPGRSGLGGLASVTPGGAM
jgi:hypothetical protein